ncbi:MAG: hypothetical protein ACYCS2_11055, partial [Acidimicrobiales bacterium]
TPTPDQVPLVSMVFTRPAIYWQAWGVMKQALASASKARGATWVTLSASDTAAASSGGQKTLVLAGSLADPFLYLDMLQSGAGTARFVRSTVIGGSATRLYRVSINTPRAASAVPGLYSGLVQLLGGASGTSTLTLQMWMGPKGDIEQLGFSSAGGPASGPAGGTSGSYSASTTGNLPTMDVTLSFAGPDVPASSSVAPAPAATDSLSLASVISAGSSGNEANQAPSTETCAEDKADGGKDAKGCSTTPTSGG